MSNEQKERLIQEAQQVTERLNKLNTFMVSEQFSKLHFEDKELLYVQQRVMGEYCRILSKRIDRCE